MGFLDKIKTFTSASSMVSIQFLEIERQDPATASMPLTDSGLKGKYLVTCNAPCTVLGHVDEFRTRCGAKDGTLGTLRVSDKHDASDPVIGRHWQFPLDMKPGDSVELWFNLHGLDIASYYASYGVPPLDPSVELFIKVIVDVKGSPFDPEAEAVFRVHG